MGVFLLSKSLVSEQTSDAAKEAPAGQGGAVVLTRAIIAKIRDDSAAFHDLVSALNEQSPISDSIVDHLMKKYQKTEPVTLYFKVQPIGFIVFEGESVELKCEAVGEPPPTYLWYKDSQPLPDQVSNVLSIERVTKEDAGNYYCQASNENDTAVSNKAYVIMREKEVAALNNAKENIVDPVQESATPEADQHHGSGGARKSGFSEGLSVRGLYDWLKSEGVASVDCKKLKDEQVSGQCFMDLTEDDMKSLQISFGGRKLITKLQGMPRATQGAVAGSSTPPSGNILDINHLRFLVNETWDAHCKWEHVGTGLGIDRSTLDSIGAAKRDKPVDCYPEMLSTWLRRDGATWEQLLEVLESRVVDLKQVATAVRSLPLDTKIKIGYTVPSNTRGIPRDNARQMQKQSGHNNRVHPPCPSDDDCRIDFTGVDSTNILNIDDDFTEVIKEVGDLAANYVSLGLALHVTHAEIEIVKNTHRDDPKKGLQEVVVLWLNQTYNIEKFGNPTWRMLAEAVANPHGGSNCAIARTIAANHPSH